MAQSYHSISLGDDGIGIWLSTQKDAERRLAAYTIRMSPEAEHKLEKTVKIMYAILVAFIFAFAFQGVASAETIAVSPDPMPTTTGSYTTTRSGGTTGVSLSVFRQTDGKIEGWSQPFPNSGSDFETDFGHTGYQGDTWVGAYVFVSLTGTGSSACTGTGATLSACEVDAVYVAQTCVPMGGSGTCGSPPAPTIAESTTTASTTEAIIGVQYELAWVIFYLTLIFLGFLLNTLSPRL